LILKIANSAPHGPYFAVEIDDDHRDALERVSRKIGKYLVKRAYGVAVPADMVVAATPILNANFQYAKQLVEAFAPYVEPNEGLHPDFDGQFAYSVRDVAAGGWVAIFRM